MGRVEYEDCRLTSEEWKTIKPITPFGGVPVLHWDGEEIPQDIQDFCWEPGS